MSKSAWKTGSPLSQETQERLRELIRNVGDAKRAADMLEISSTSILRGAVGLGMRKGTILLIETKLAKLAAPKEAAA